MNEIDYLKADLERERAARRAVDQSLQNALAAIKRSTGYGRRTLAVSSVREMTVALVFEVESTLRLIEQLPAEQPSASDVRDLRRVLDYRKAQVKRAGEALEDTLAGALNAELLLARKKAS